MVQAHPEAQKEMSNFRHLFFCLTRTSTAPTPFGLRSPYGHRASLCTPRQPYGAKVLLPSLPLSTEQSIYIQGSVIYCRNSASEIHLMIKHNLWYFLLNSKLSRPENAIAPPELNTFSPSELNTSKFVSNVTKCVRLTPLIPSASDAIVSNPHNKSPLFSMQNETVSNLLNSVDSEKKHSPEELTLPLKA